MPPRISASTRNKVISTRLLGFGRNDTAKKTKQSRGTVTREIERFGAMIDKEGVEAAGVEYKVSEKLQELLEVADIARENNLEVYQLAGGV